MPNYNETVGLLKRGTVVGYDIDTGIMQVKLTNNSAIKGSDPAPIEIQGPHPISYNNGIFIGTVPSMGTTVVVGQGRGGEYHFVSFIVENQNLVPNLEKNVLLIQSNDETKITLNTKDVIQIGSTTNNIHIDTSLNTIRTNLKQSYAFTQATREVTGEIKRDKNFNKKFSQFSKLESQDYEAYYKSIGMDPKLSIDNPIKNPPFVEQREIVYEFGYDSDIEDDLSESTKYGKTEAIKKTKTKYIRPNRRLSRSDTLSLSLASPNFLMETIKGTVVDIFGNILDLNRFPLPVGKGDATLDTDNSSDKIKAFYSIKEMERRSIAFHFELNARKDLNDPVKKEKALPDFTSTDDYARSRSRFFLDIDKEGQFKLNVPASSETGNIPLLSRYENYSTIGDDDSGNPNKLVYREDNLDIFHDSFAAPAISLGDSGASFAPKGARGSISIIDDDGGRNIEDRISRTVIKHGTAYHDILKTCILHQDKKYLKSPSPSYLNPEIINRISELQDVVSDTITISSARPDAGGRSGQINFDGSIELNIGANSVDRQSMWMDTAGGVVYNIGKDIRGRSVLASTTGDFILQVGGFTVSGDSRFPEDNTGSSVLNPSLIDLRIMTSGGYCHMIRCDQYGVTILTPGSMNLHAAADLTITSDTKIVLKAPEITVHDRPALNAPVGSW